MHVAVIGAGMAGLTCASRLAEAGHHVAVFDKGRGPGGRMATRRVEHEGATFRFDHGAQYFTAREMAFQTQVRAWEADGIVALWPAAKDGAWVGTPGMNAPIRAMAEALEVRFGTRIAGLVPERGGWRLEGEGKRRGLPHPARARRPLRRGRDRGPRRTGGATARRPRTRFRR